MKNRIWNHPWALGLFLAGICLLLNACTGLTSTNSVGNGGGGGGTPAASLSPGSLTFASQTVNTTSAAQSVTLTNSGSAALSLTSVAISGTNGSDFAQTNTCGSSVNANASCTISVTFTPTAAGTRTANVSITDNATGSPQTVSLTGTGATAGGNPAVTLSPTSLTFASQTVNTTSAAQSVTLTNSGSAALSLTSVAITGTNSTEFAQTDTCGTSVNANASCTISVTFTPTAAGTRTANVSITDNATGSPQSISLTGTGAAAGALAVTTTLLPLATQSANYIGFLRATGGTPPYTWSMASGSSLTTGLLLDSASGVIFGTAPATTGTAPNFTVQVTDSAAATASAALSITTDAATGANCNNVYLDLNETGPSATLTPTPLTINNILTGPHVVPLDDLGTGTYLGQQGGLYPGGSNVRPSSYDATGVTLANSIVPLDANGNQDLTSGKMVLMSIGMSNAKGEFGQFIVDETGDASLNPALVLVNGAQAGCDAIALANSQSSCWTTTLSALTNNVPTVTAKQVVAAWVKEAIADPSSTGTFPKDATTLQGDLEKIAQNLKTFFPNIKLAYYATRINANYATTNQNPEPFAYESGFAVKFTIADSINGTLTNAPWLSWGPYMWANGMLPRSDGTVWTCQDVNSDGTHPSALGEEKVAQMLKNFFHTDDTTTPWFLHH